MKMDNITLHSKQLPFIAAPDTGASEGGEGPGQQPPSDSDSMTAEYELHRD